MEFPNPEFEQRVPEPGVRTEIPHPGFEDRVSGVRTQSFRAQSSNIEFPNREFRKKSSDFPCRIAASSKCGDKPHFGSLSESQNLAQIKNQWNMWLERFKERDKN